MISLNKFRLTGRHRKKLDCLNDDDKVKFILNNFKNIEGIGRAVDYYDLNKNHLLRTIALSKLKPMKWHDDFSRKNKAFSAFYFAFFVIKGRWIEAEEIIKSDARSAYLYAKDVIKGRWIEAEEVIKKDSEYAYYYAKDVIKGRWIEAEEIIKNDADLAVRYALHVIKGRWIEAEEVIYKNISCKKNYEYYLDIISRITMITHF